MSPATKGAEPCRSTRICPSGPQDAVTVSGAATYTLGIERRLVAAVETIDGGDVWITRFKGGTWGWVSLGHP